MRSLDLRVKLWNHIPHTNTHTSDIWREHLDTHWNHKNNTHALWKTIHGLANLTKNNTITFKVKQSPQAHKSQTHSINNSPTQSNFRINVHVYWQNHRVGSTLLRFKKNLHWLIIQDRITYKILMLTYKSYYNIAPTYLCELISRRESSVNTRLGADHHQLIMPPISKDCSNTFLERSFICAAPCEWNKLSECIRTSTFDSFRKSVKTMLFTQQYGCWVKIVDNIIVI